MQVLLAQDTLGPVFKPSVTFIDFGTVDSKTDAGFYILHFTNEGKAPLLFRFVQTSADYAVAHWPYEPIAPGKTGEIKVKYDLNQIRPIFFTMNIGTNEVDGKDAEGNVIYKKHVIKVKGNVK
jgi:hypothetical protein